MKVEVKIPSVGESVTEATVANILKPKGSQVKEGDEIIELETDKVNQIVYAPASGTLDLKVKVDDIVTVGQVIGTIDSEKGAAASSAAPIKESTPPPSPKKEQTGASLRSKEADYLSDLKKKPQMPALKSEKPEERKEEKKEVAANNRQRRERMSKLRRVIGERLMEVKNQTAMLTTFNEVDLTNVMEVRKREQENFQKKHGVKLGFMSFFVKAAVAALQAYPDINAFIDKDEIVYCDYYDIGVAVSTEKGLMVPVLRDCDKLSFSDVERKLKEFAESARTGAISISDMKGGTFTITNGGVFGSLLSTPILNPPQSGILGMHAIQERPVAIQGKVEVRSMMYLALSYDHRIVDGKEAISFLVHMKKNLEDPSRLLLDI